LGAIVYHAQLVIETGVNNYWKLKAIDSIQSSVGVAIDSIQSSVGVEEYERIKLIKTIIDDSRIEGILIAQR